MRSCVISFIKKWWWMVIWIENFLSRIYVLECVSLCHFLKRFPRKFFKFLCFRYLFEWISLMTDFHCKYICICLYWESDVCEYFWKRGCETRLRGNFCHTKSGRICRIRKYYEYLARIFFSIHRTSHTFTWIMNNLICVIIFVHQHQAFKSRAFKIDG